MTWRTDLFTQRDYRKTLLTDFIGNVRRTNIVQFDQQLLDTINFNSTNNNNQSIQQDQQSQRQFHYIPQMPISD